MYDTISKNIVICDEVVLDENKNYVVNRVKYYNHPCLIWLPPEKEILFS